MVRLDNPQQTAFFIRGPSPLARLVFFGALSIALMVMDSRLHYLVEIRQGFAAMIRPLEVVVSTPIAAVNFVGQYINTQTRLVAENNKLRESALSQALDLQRFRALQTENAHLRELLGAAQASPHTAYLGEIAHTGRDLFARKALLNVGERHNISAGQAVIDQHGVIGQVTRVYPFTSEVTLITSKDLAVPIQVERTGMRAIAFGHGRASAINLPFLPTNVDIQPGDLLITSGIDGIYPAGLPVAKVVEVERNSHSTFARITCTPIAGINTHKQVLIVETLEQLPSGQAIAKPEAEKPATQHAPRQP